MTGNLLVAVDLEPGPEWEKIRMNDVGVRTSVPHRIFHLGSVSVQFDLVRVEAVEPVVVLAPLRFRWVGLVGIGGDTDFTPMHAVKAFTDQ
jgi:hypothetical protein